MRLARAFRRFVVATARHSKAGRPRRSAPGRSRRSSSRSPGEKKLALKVASEKVEGRGRVYLRHAHCGRSRHRPAQSDRRAPVPASAARAHQDRRDRCDGTRPAWLREAPVPTASRSERYLNRQRVRDRSKQSTRRETRQEDAARTPCVGPLQRVTVFDNFVTSLVRVATSLTLHVTIVRIVHGSEIDCAFKCFLSWMSDAESLTVAQRAVTRTIDTDSRSFEGGM